VLQTISHPVGVQRGVNSRLSRNTVPYLYLQIEGSGRPVSRILLYPAIHLRGLKPRAPLGAAPTSPTSLLQARRDNLACSHRSFTWPVPRGIPPVGSYPTLSPITCAGR
jgi:hypothetical protein